MAYLEEFRSQLNQRNFNKMLQLWQEYCASDTLDTEEVKEILTLIKLSEFAKPFGDHVTQFLPLMELIKDEKEYENILCLIFDLQTKNGLDLQTLAINHLKKRFGSDPLFNEKLKLVGLRIAGESFQGALSNFILLNHLAKGNFVLHTAGWGVGEIMDLSFLREQASIEFEHIHSGKKDISFKNAFKTLLPVEKNHFYVRRFADADALEKDVKENPIECLKQLLKDLGPRTSSEIKDELVGYVIPEEEYTKWWQQVRSKLKKEPLIEAPDNIKEPFRLRKGHASWEERLEKAFLGKKSFEDTLSSAHTLVRDFPELLKNPDAKVRLIEKIQGLLQREHVREAERLQVLLFLENPLGVNLEESSLEKYVKSLHAIEELIPHVEIVALRKKLLTSIREYRSDWKKIFFHLLFSIEPNQLKDYILKELSQPETIKELQAHIHELIQHPKKHPEAFLWYFQKVIDDSEPFFKKQEEKWHVFEALFIVLNQIENKEEFKDLTKKIFVLITGNKFELVRNFLKDTTLSQASEFLLLASKCHTLTSHDQKILRSLSAVVHPSLAEEKKSSHAFDPHVIWTTQHGYEKVHDRIKHIGTVEIVDVAKEIEAARALGDLRENAEYKAAIERRSRLQSELKQLSDQYHKARVITKDDVHTSAVGIGTKVELKGNNGKNHVYTILGPWDANPDKNILSFQSRFAQAMAGKKKGDSFLFNGEEFTIVSIASYIH